MKIFECFFSTVLFVISNGLTEMQFCFKNGQSGLTKQLRVGWPIMLNRVATERVANSNSADKA